jgi:hypothetical protein
LATRSAHAKPMCDETGCASDEPGIRHDEIGRTVQFREETSMNSLRRFALDTLARHLSAVVRPSTFISPDLLSIASYTEHA